jgi:hypothetical protein
MDKHKIRLTTIAGATMALVIASTAVVSAHPGDGRRGMDDEMGPMGMGRMDGTFGMGPLGGLRGWAGDVERREVTIQTADGTTTERMEQGVVDSASDTSLAFSLGSGEAVTVTIDADTQVIAFEEDTVTTRRGWSRQLLAPTEIAATDIAAGADVVVWSDSADGSDYVAQRIVVQPQADETALDVSADETTDVEAGTAEAAQAEASPATDA